MATGCPLSARQKFVLRWLADHDTHKASWDERFGYMTIRGHGCCIRVKESDWHAMSGLIDGVPVPTKIFGPNAAGMAASR